MIFVHIKAYDLIKNQFLHKRQRERTRRNCMKQGLNPHHLFDSTECLLLYSRLMKVSKYCNSISGCKLGTFPSAYICIWIITTNLSNITLAWVSLTSLKSTEVCKLKTFCQFDLIDVVKLCLIID